MRECNADSSDSDGDERGVGRRPFLRSLGAAGASAAGALPASAGASAATQDGEWPDVDDPYYAELVDEFEAMGLPPGEFVYADDEAGTAAAYETLGDVAETSALEVGDAVPFREAVRIEVTEAPTNPWDVTHKGVVEDRPVEEGDVLLGVAYLRSGGDGEAEARYVAKDEAHQSTNVVRNANQPTLDGEFKRLFFRIQFDYAAEAGTWWTEFFLGFDAQVVDVGGLALLSFGGDADLEALPTWEPDREPSGDDWRAAADRRIREHRTAPLEVVVTGANGEPVGSAAVAVEMREHAFGFGTAVDAPTLLEEGEDAETYRRRIPELFNTAVMGNHHKWRFWEEERETADEATRWLLDRGLTVRGHVCLWADVDAWAVPPDVVSAMGVEWPENGVTDPEADPEHVRRRTTEHVPAIVEHYADFGEYGSAVDEWEVVNEQLHQPGFVEAIHGEDVEPTEAPVLAEWYRLAREAAPEGVSLAVNDYNVLAGPYEGTRDAYEDQLRFLAASDVDLGGVGMQCHFAANERLHPDEILAGLDRYAEYADGLRVTEFDTYQGNWRDAEQQADYLEQFLVTAFSHEAVEDFLLWGFWDERHWGDDAPLFESDWSEKPAHDVWTNLVFEEWWTSESGSTTADGTFTVDAFEGDHEVTVGGGASETVTTTVAGEGATVEVQLDVAADEVGSGADGADPEGGDGGSRSTATSPGLGVATGLAGIAGAVGWALRGRDDEDP